MYPLKRDPSDKHGQDVVEESASWRERVLLWRIKSPENNEWVFTLQHEQDGVAESRRADRLRVRRKRQKDRQDQIDYESPDCKVFALGVGYVKTKIHKATLDAKWPNERIARGDDGTPIERIWGCLKWCIQAPKSAVGGRNIVVSDPWDTTPLAERLIDNPSLFKLRRIE